MTAFKEDDRVAATGNFACAQERQRSTLPLDRMAEYFAYSESGISNSNCQGT
ncbi:hypothetical protein PM082_016578 [Marasmius tenuissimus]|nr:hypothetical protein PM082_016578 [Marasmius tenuissimus]